MDSMLTPEYRKDLEQLKADIQAEKIRTVDFMIHVSRSSAKDLAVMGYRSGIHGDAYTNIINQLNGKIKKLTDAYIKKYPDD